MGGSDSPRNMANQAIDEPVAEQCGAGLDVWRFVSDGAKRHLPGPAKRHLPRPVRVTVGFEGIPTV
jgi:hypothetical protein